MAAGLPLPKRLIVHGHWTAERTKISKSLGNAIDPVALMQQYGRDPLRYFMLREGRLDVDTDFSLSSLVSTVNTELSNQLGNLLSRAFNSHFLSAIKVENSGGATAVSADVSRMVKETCQRCANLYDEFNFAAGLECLQVILRMANSRFTEQEPWNLVKGGKREGLNQLLADIGYVCLAYAVMVTPVVPGIARSVFNIFAADGCRSSTYTYYYSDILNNLLRPRLKGTPQGQILPRLQLE